MQPAQTLELGTVDLAQLHPGLAAPVQVDEMLMRRRRHEPFVFGRMRAAGDGATHAASQIPSRRASASGHSPEQWAQTTMSPVAGKRETCW